MSLKNELQTIISGIGYVTKSSAIQAAANYLRKSKTASAGTEKEEHIKEQEVKTLLDYASKHSFFLTNLNKERYLAEGAEQKVYLDEDGQQVIKLNDTIFYNSWNDYFNSLLLHNYFFPATCYELIGLYIEENRLYAAVKQPYIISTEKTSEESVKEIMASNGFLIPKMLIFIMVH